MKGVTISKGRIPLSIPRARSLMNIAAKVGKIPPPSRRVRPAKTLVAPTGAKFGGCGTRRRTTQASSIRMGSIVAPLLPSRKLEQLSFGFVDRETTGQPGRLEYSYGGGR